MLSIRVADCSVILVGLFIADIKLYDSILLTNSAVAAWLFEFNKFKLKSPAIVTRLFLYPLWIIFKIDSRSELNTDTSIFGGLYIDPMTIDCLYARLRQQH